MTFPGWDLDQDGQPPAAPRRGRLRGRWIAAGAAGLVLLAGGAVTASRQLPDDPWPEVILTESAPDTGTVLASGGGTAVAGHVVQFVPALWQAGADGRPSGPVVLAGTVDAERLAPASMPQLGRIPLFAVGLTGPGIVRNRGAAVRIPESGRVTVAFEAEVDCARVTRDVPTSSYGLLVSGSASGGAARRLGTGGPVTVWALAVRRGCAAWTARRALTVTELSAQADPASPELALTLTVTNTGDTAGVIGRNALLQDAGPVQTSGPLPLTVPPRGTARVGVTVRVEDCALVRGRTPAQVPAVTSMLGLVAYAGSPPPPVPVRDDPAVTPWAGTWPTEILLAASAGEALQTALQQVCGTGSGPQLSVAPGGLRLDRAADDLAIDVVVDTGTPGARSVTLVADGLTGGSVSLQPTAGTVIVTVNGQAMMLTAREPRSADAVPDAAGLARVTLHLAVPTGTGLCHPESLIVPGWRVEIAVPRSSGGGTRTVPLRASLDLAALAHLPGCAA